MHRGKSPIQTEYKPEGTRADIRPTSSRVATCCISTLLVLVAAGSVTYPQPENPHSVITDRTGRIVHWLDSADRHHRSGAYHLEAEALEEALALLESGDPLRNTTAHRLIRLYRSGLGRFERAAEWVQILAEELRPTPEGIDALFELADTQFNHGRLDQAYQTYREILGRIMAPDPPWERFDKRCWPAWHGEQLSRYPKGTDPLFPASVTVSAQLGQFLQLARSGNWVRASSLLDQNLALRSPLEWESEPKTWISAREWLARTTSGLPDNSLRALEDYYASSIEAIVALRDWRELREYRFQHPVPGLETRLNIAIGDRLMEASMPALASLHYGMAAEGNAQDAPPLLAAKHFFSRICAGDEVPLSEIPVRQVTLGGKTRSLQDLAEAWHPPPKQDVAHTSPLDPQQAVISQIPLIRAPLPLIGWQIRWIAREKMELPDFAEEFVPYIPAGTLDSLIVNLGTAVEAIDVVGQRVLWTFLAPEENPMMFPNQKWRTRKNIIECARAGKAAVDRDVVLCNLVWGHHNTTRYAGGLFALRRSDGATLWSSLQVPELAGLQIAGEPALYRGVVVTLAWRPQEAIPLFYVVGIAEETGEVLWTNHLFSGDSLTVRDNEIYLHRPLASGQPAVADGIAYMNTGAGVVAAIKAADGSLDWAIEYPRVKAINNSEWAARMAISRPAGVIAVFEDVVLFAPTDSHRLLAVDRATGELRYSRENLDLRAIAAFDARYAYLVEGTSVRAIHPADGETMWRRSFPVTGMVGLPSLSERGLWCPTWEALYLVSPANGEILGTRRWSRDEAGGSILDFGDRMVAASRVGLQVLAEAPLDADHVRLLSPEWGAPTTELQISSRADQWLRWAVPLVNRGEFILSDADPDHMIMRSELIEMRAIDPLPALLWERLSPLPWDYDVAFDREHVAVWDRSRLFVLDASSGVALWNDELAEPLEEAPGWGVVLYGDQLFWWGKGHVHCYRAADGEKRWESQPGGSIQGIRPVEEGVGIYLDSGGPSAVLLDAETGDEKSHISIPRVTPAPRPPPPPERKPPQLASLPGLIVGKEGPGSRSGSADLIFVNSAAPVRIDWSKARASVGEAIEIPLRGEGFGGDLIIYGKYAALRGRDNDWHIYHEPLIAVWDLETMSRIRVPNASRWSIHGDILYTFLDHRLHAFDLRLRKPLWQSLTVKDHCRVMVPTDNEVLLLNQDERWGEDDIRDVSYVRIFDAHTGEQTKAFPITKRWMHVLDQQRNRLLMWDCTFLYNLHAPGKIPTDAGTPPVIVATNAGPDAVAGLRIARDLENPPHLEVQSLAAPPRIDADLTDWNTANVRYLDTIMAWKPDFAHRSSLKPRGYGGKEDISAWVRIGRAGDSYYLGLEVIDDVHVADPAPGLCRSDSVTLYCGASKGAEVDPTMLTIALAGGGPRFELGTAATGVAASDPPGYDPEVKPGARSFVLSPLVSAGSFRIPPGTSVEVAIERDEASRKTVYEFKVARAAWPIESDMFWDVIVNDDDGHGREGALQLASSVWGIEETLTGALRDGSSE